MRLIPIFVLVFLLVSCGKDQFTTKPQLIYKSANAGTISGAQTLSFKLDLTDKEGDYITFFGIKKTVPGCPNSGFIDSALFTIPQDFINTKKLKGEVVVILDENTRKDNQCSLPGPPPQTKKPDTATFRFWTRDKAGHVSDTAVSGPIIILN